MSEKNRRRRGAVSTVGFVLIVLTIVGLGLGGVMVVTTSIGAQSRELAALKREANELEYESAGLTTQIETLSSTASLALRATDLGMVPNPYPVFVSLADGKVLGEPTPVRGNELPQLRGVPPKVETTPVPDPDTSTPGPVPPDPDGGGADAAAEDNPDDVVAAEQPGGEQPGGEQPDTAQPDTAQPDAEQPDAEQPDAEQPGDEG